MINNTSVDILQIQNLGRYNVLTNVSQLTLACANAVALLWSRLCPTYLELMFCQQVAFTGLSDQE